MVGASIHRQVQISGRYNPEGGDLLKEDLGFDQLHQKVFRPNGFLALAFRFGASPFKKPAAPEETEEKK